MTSDLALIQALQPSAIDKILLHIAFSAMRASGHRHGAFLEAAATAAKCAIYLTYLEQGQNLRAAAQLHHLEPKRVKAIVEEVQRSLTEGRLLRLLGSQEPHYLIQFPHLWLEHYSWTPGQPRIASMCLTTQEKRELEIRLSSDMPMAQLILDVQFRELIEILYNRSQERFLPEQRLPLSEAMAEHIQRRLLHSGTVVKIDSSWGVAFYALTRTSYSPVDQETRTSTVLEETARYFQLMQLWANRQPRVMRVLEELDIDPDSLDQAMAELDTLIHNWADKYHRVDGVPFVVQMACGPNDGSDSPN